MNAGWHRDPTGRKELRYWDGSTWTDHVSVAGNQSSDPISGDYAPPVAQSPSTVAVKQKRAKWPWVLGAIVLLLGGCSALVVAAVDNAVDELNAEQRRHAITKAQFDAVALGTPKAQVIETLGKQPEDQQEFVHEGVLDEEQLKRSCIYYNRVGESFGAPFQFCFDGNDALDAKNAY